MKRVGVILAASIAMFAVLAALAVVHFNRFLDAPLAVPEAGVVFTIEPGASFRHVSDALADQGIVDRPGYLRWYARLTDRAGKVHAGEYLIETGSTPRTLLEDFTSGAVRLHSFTIVPGWTFRELLAALSREPLVESTLEYEDWPSLLETLGAESGHPEGLFLPETYRFPRGTTDRQILRQAYELLQQTLDEAWQNRTAGLPIATPYEALILASIIEKETALAAERPMIAGVFVRRLQQGMRLQTDPTVIYGIGEAFDGNLTRAHLRTDTPYNTYTRGGLPPTPIALPGRAAIEAALNPADGTSLYFVATGLGDGSHKFSATKAEHDAAVQEYLARQRAQRNGRQSQ